jgi:hypothetical protein
LPVAGGRLPVAGCRLPVAGCRLPVAGCRKKALPGEQGSKNLRDADDGASMLARVP